METVLLIAIVVAAIALFFDFTNGFNDSANQVATIIFSRALRPSLALLTAATANFIGAYFLGTAVARTIGAGIVDPRVFHKGSSGIIVISSALIGAILWNLISWHFSIPSSSSHALIGGLIGAFLFGWGSSPINWTKVEYIIAIMIAAPIAGFFITYIFTRLTVIFSQWSSPKINNIFKKLQIVSLITQSLSHGMNDAQKTMGVLAFALASLGFYASKESAGLFIPDWVIISCALAMALGTLIGGRRIIKKLGSGLYKVRPIHGFASQAASSLIIYFTAFFGFPISTSQVISSSVMGAGAAFRPKMIRWQVAKDMVMVWFITIPVSALAAGLSFLVLNKIF
ncbi:MAG: inorganic phosphate transporter [bacterium]|nr:inorganic phosphate transporter [bacterium]